jgi:hypothetical protein
LERPFLDKNPRINANEGEEKDEGQTHSSRDYNRCAQPFRVVEIGDEALKVISKDHVKTQ